MEEGDVRLTYPVTINSSMGFTDRLIHGWNAFRGKDTSFINGGAYSYGSIEYSNPSRTYINVSNERTILASIINKIAIDAAMVEIHHVRVNDDGQYMETIPSALNNCLSFDANIDQAAMAFRLDIFMSLLDEGAIAICPIEADKTPNEGGGYYVSKLRVAKILEWYPSHVRVKIYNEQDGKYEELIYDKRNVAIVENPKYSVMNEPNSTLKRLERKLTLLDRVDEQNSSGKLDILIQLPYTLKSALKKEQAEQRRKDIEMQLTGSKYGIAYIDGTEKVTQLNRPAENSLISQIQDLKKELFTQLGMTDAVFYGSAKEEEKLNYYNSSVNPMLTAVCEAIQKVFITKTGRTQGQRIMYFRDPFKLVPVSQIADIADKFTRNEVLSPNEVRAIVGRKPDKNPKSNELRNRNLNQSDPSVLLNQPVDTKKEATDRGSLFIQSLLKSEKEESNSEQ